MGMKMSKEKLAKLKMNSKVVYYDPEPDSKSISEPIYMSSNFQYDREIYQSIVDGERKVVNIYTRCGNPTEYKLEEQMKVIESADDCLVTASGMAAISITLFALLKAGDHVIADWTTYSTTHEMLDHRWTDFGVETTFVDTADIEQIKNAIRPNTKIIFFETIANPNMKTPSIPPIVELAHKNNIVVICDNTFASPYVIRPLEFGVDIVVESATKFIGGHNDALGGVIAVKYGLLEEDFTHYMRWNALTKLGGAISPFNAWLLLRGVQTLAVRVERQCESAKILADYFESHPKVKRVWYPGLESHPQHETSKEQMPMGGAMICFEVGREDWAVDVLTSLELGSFAASLGGVRTTTQVPSTMAFLDVPPEQKERMNVRDGMIRVSVGLEDVDDIIADFEQALATI